MNPLQRGIKEFLERRLQSSLHGQPVTATRIEVSKLPKRYTIYPPLVVLQPNFATLNPEWRATYSGLDASERDNLFGAVVEAFRSQRSVVTHVAINAPIRLADEGSGEVNVSRSPSGLVPVYGDFGPRTMLSGAQEPTSSDFERALWVSTVQNGEIVQVWAPLWTMFSRGNVREKARILGQVGWCPGLDEAELGQRLDQVDVVDLYVGIGYFAFSYLKRGVRRVWGWEINAWSVEALRRGAERNGFDVAIVRLNRDGAVDEVGLQGVLQRLLATRSEKPQCIVFHGDNRYAASVVNEVSTRMAQATETSLLNIRHANLGLLPSSSGSWQVAVQCLNRARRGWVHVHENVDMMHINEKEGNVVETLKQMADIHFGTQSGVRCLHVEQVKTYAPGVMHCVFEIEILPSR